MADEDYNFKTVSAKVTQEEFSQFKDYCDKKGVKPSPQLREFIMREIQQTVPVNISGRTVFHYSKNSDSFQWKVLLDNGRAIDVVKNLSPQYVDQLFDTLSKAVDERNSYLKRSKSDSVPIPNRFGRSRK